MVKNRYLLLGSGLALAGVAFAPTSYLLLRSIPLTALGISLVILGIVCLALGRTLPRISEVSMILLETGLENLSALLEEMGLRTKGIYLPSSLTRGRPQALIPLHSNPSLPQIGKALPRRLIVRFGSHPEELGLLVTTPGSATVEMLEAKPGPTSGEIDAALTSVLVGVLDIAEGIEIHLSDKKASVGVSRPHLEYRKTWLYDSLGSPLASIVASVVAEALDKPIVVVREQPDRRMWLIELGILE